VPARRAGLLCTVFVPETKRIDLDEAALHSESHFGKFMRSIGRPQARPQRPVPASVYTCLLVNSQCYMLKLGAQYRLVRCGQYVTSDQAPASVRRKCRMGALRKHALCRSAALCTCGAAGYHAQVTRAETMMLSFSPSFSRDMCCKGHLAADRESGRRGRSTRPSRRASTAARTGRATACTA